MMNRLATLLGALLALLATAAPALASDDTPVLSRIEQRGELVLGTSANMPPMTYRQPDGKHVGLDIDIARLMAKALGVKLRIETLPFDALLPALRQGKVDVVISNMTITPERNRSVAFVGPYMTSGKCLITRQARLAQAEHPDELDTPDTRVVVMKGSTSEAFARTLLPKASVTTTANLKSGIEMVRDNRVGAMMTDFPVCLSTLRNYPDAGFVSLFSRLNYEPIGIALPANDPLFINWTQNFLTRLDATGLLEQIGEHWFGEYAGAIRAGELNPE